MLADNNDEELLTPAQAARRLGVSPVTVRSWVSKGWLDSHSTPGGHSRFKWNEAQKFIERSQLAREGAGRIKILIVDDEKLFRNYLRESLSILLPQAIIREAVDGFNAGLELANIRPDLDLLDYSMPGINGLAVCRMIRDNPEYKSLQVVAISGHINFEVSMELMETGVDKLLHKAVSQADFRNILSDLNMGVGL